MISESMMENSLIKQDNNILKGKVGKHWLQ